MGIYIKGIDLPSCCDKCPFKSYVGVDHLKCKITGYRFYAWEVGWGDKPYVRHNSCPLIELHPHGDLIDRNALVRKFEEIKESIGYAEVPLALAVAGAINDIKKTPTVIEAEPCNDLAKPNDTIFAVQNTDEDEWLFAAKPIDYMHHPSVEEIIKGYGE